MPQDRTTPPGVQPIDSEQGASAVEGRGRGHRPTITVNLDATSILSKVWIFGSLA